MGQSYANRSDLRQRTVAPATAPTGLPYGEHQQLVNAQRAIPVGSPPVPSAPPSAPTSAAPVVQPGSLPFVGPTARPNEPVQAGLPSGPGPGPEALRGVGANLGQQDTAGGIINQAAQRSPSPDLQALAQFVNGGMR